MAELDYQYIGKLVEQAKAGDTNAFAELYAATYQKQFAFANHYLKDPYLAQDALQESYILVLKNLSKLKDPQLFISWLNQITFRVCFKMFQKQSRYNSEQSGDYEKTSPSQHNPEEDIIRIDQQDYIVKQLLSLPFSESQAIILKYYHDMKLEDIAALMNCSRSSVKRYLNSGYIHLRDLIS